LSNLKEILRKKSQERAGAQDKQVQEQSHQEAQAEEPLEAPRGQKAKSDLNFKLPIEIIKREENAYSEEIQAM